MALGLHAVWREPVLRQLTPGMMKFGVGYVSFPLEAIGACWMHFTNDGGLVVVRVRYSGSTCGCLLRGGRAGIGRRGNLSDICGYCSGPWCVAALMSRGCVPNQSLPLFIHLGSSGIAGAFLYHAAVNAAMPETLSLVLREDRVSCDGAFWRIWMSVWVQCAHKSLTLVWLRWVRACPARVFL